MSAAVCSRCGEPVLWVQTFGRGRWMPLDPEPSDSGRVILTRTGEALVLRSDREALDHCGRGSLRSCHLDTCSKRKEARRGRM